MKWILSLLMCLLLLIAPVAASPPDKWHLGGYDWEAVHHGQTVEYAVLNDRKEVCDVATSYCSIDGTVKTVWHMKETVVNRAVVNRLNRHYFQQE